MMAPSGFDWPSLLRLGLQVLKLPPERFWQLTPIELRIMLGIEHQKTPLNRARLAELISAFPDHIKGIDDELNTRDEGPA